MSRVVVVAGPTAAGKSAVALALAERLGWTLVSADAMQVYRGLDIGTGKPTPEERARVRHVGVDVVAPAEPFDAADFVALCEAAMAKGPVVVCGGTTLYLQALRRGLVEAPAGGPALRAELEALPDLHAALAAVDPALAARLHPHDRVRLLRGLEVHRLTGERLSALQEAHAARPDRHELVGVWLDRPDLDARIDARVLAMIDAGYVDEVRGLLADGVSPDCKPMRSLGYRHLTEHLLSDLPIDEAVRRTQRDTRLFARKQRTWRKALPLPAVGPDDAAAAVDAAARAVRG
jgi:tRNA dimethylallyltransferase